MGFFDGDFPSGQERADEAETHILYARDPAMPQLSPHHARTDGDYVIPSVVPWMLRLGAGPTAQVWLRRVDVWPGSFTLHLTTYRRVVKRSRRPVTPLEPSDPLQLHVGLRFADGTRATSVVGRFAPGPPLAADTSPIGLSLSSGSTFHSAFRAHVPLLPPKGPLTVVVAWPRERVPETETPLDASPILAAAADAVEIWPDLPPAPPAPS